MCIGAHPGPISAKQLWLSAAWVEGIPVRPGEIPLRHVTAWILSMDMAADRDAWRYRIHDANRHSNTIRRVQQTLNA